MIKKLGALLILGLLLVAGIKAYATYSAMQFIESFKQEHSKSLSLSYSWLSVDFEGNIHFEGLVLTPFSLKRPINIDKLTLGLGNASSMMTALPSLKVGKLTAPISMSYSGLRMPFKGRGLDEWMALFIGDKVLVPMSLFACGDRSSLDFSALKAMGIEELSASGRIYYEQARGKDMITLSIDIDKIGKLELALSLDLEGLNTVIETGNVSAINIHNLEMSHLDAGYARRMVNLCTEESGLEPEAYAKHASQAWRIGMAGIGMLANEAVEDLYRDKLLQGGVLKLKVEPPVPIRLGELERLYDQELVSSLGISANINGKMSQSLQLFLDGSYYRPEPVLEEKPKKPESSGQATVVLSNLRYQPTDIMVLSEFVDRKVRIELKDGKTYQGLLKSADEQKIEVTLIFGGGTADYFFANEKIELVEVWR